MNENIEYILFWLLVIFFPLIWLLIIIDYFKCRDTDKKFLEMIESKKFNEEYNKFLAARENMTQ